MCWDALSKAAMCAKSHDTTTTACSVFAHPHLISYIAKTCASTVQASKHPDGRVQNAHPLEQTNPEALSYWACGFNSTLWGFPVETRWPQLINSRQQHHHILSILKCHCKKQMSALHDLVFACSLTRVSSLFCESCLASGRSPTFGQQVCWAPTTSSNL